MVCKCSQFISERFINNRYNKFSYDEVNDQYEVLKAKYGNPCIEVKKPKGIAIWYKDKLKSKTPFNRIELWDEEVHHCVPFPHIDFLNHFIIFGINENKILDVMKISGSISYDPLKKELRARCGSEEANVATLCLATEVALGQYDSIEYVKNNNIYEKYICQLTDETFVSMLREKLKSNIDINKNNNDINEYAEIAFPGCSNKKCSDFITKSENFKDKQIDGGDEVVKNKFLNKNMEHMYDEINWPDFNI